MREMTNIVLAVTMIQTSVWIGDIMIALRVRNAMTAFASLRTTMTATRDTKENTVATAIGDKGYISKRIATRGGGTMSIAITDVSTTVAGLPEENTAVTAIALWERTAGTAPQIAVRAAVAGTEFATWEKTAGIVRRIAGFALTAETGHVRMMRAPQTVPRIADLWTFAAMIYVGRGKTAGTVLQTAAHADIAGMGDAKGENHALIALETAENA